MPADRMAKQAKPRYELRWRNEAKTYIGLWDVEPYDDHCLAAICTKKPRGLLDAQSLLIAMNSYKDLLAVCEKIRDLEEFWFNIDTDPPFRETEAFNIFLRVLIRKAKAAIENAEPKQNIFKETAK